MSSFIEVNVRGRLLLLMLLSYFSGRDVYGLGASSLLGSRCHIEAKVGRRRVWVVLVHIGPS